MSLRRNIYVSNVFGYDMTKAEEYLTHGGQMIYLTEGKIDMKRLESTVRAKLALQLESFTERDYLLLAGPISVSALCTALLGRRFDNINVLIWEPRLQRYMLMNY